MELVGHIHCPEEHSVIRQVLVNCVRSTSDSLSDDVPNLDSRKAIEIAKTEKSRTASALQRLANLFMGNCSRSNKVQQLGIPN